MRSILKGFAGMTPNEIADEVALGGLGRSSSVILIRSPMSWNTGWTMQTLMGSISSIHHAGPGHALESGMGERSPLGRLYDLDARILLLGAGHANNSSFHLAESRVPKPRRHSTGAAVSTPTGRQWIAYDEVELDSGDFAALGAAFDAAGHTCLGRVGSAESRLLGQRDAVDFAVESFGATGDDPRRGSSRPPSQRSECTQRSAPGTPPLALGGWCAQMVMTILPCACPSSRRRIAAAMSLSG